MCFVLQELWSPCLSACPCRRELSYFGVKVAMIEPGFFKTNVTKPEAISQGYKTAWNQASPEIKDLYGDTFLALCEWAVDLGERSKPCWKPRSIIRVSSGLRSIVQALTPPHSGDMSSIPRALCGQQWPKDPGGRLGDHCLSETFIIWGGNWSQRGKTLYSWQAGVRRAGFQVFSLTVFEDLQFM